MTIHYRRLGITLAAALVATTAACGNFLDVTNPSAVDVRKFSDSTDANLLVNGAIGHFQTMIGNTALYGGLLTDESKSAHVNISYNQLDQRDLNSRLDLVELTYDPIQRARFDGDTVANLIAGYDGANAGTDARIARMLTLSGFSSVILGETFCSAPVGGGTPYAPDALFKMSIAKFDSAVTIARAASAAGKNKAAADSIANLALVGAARASLDLGDNAKATSYASQVSSGFMYTVNYKEGIPTTPGLPVNPFWNAMGSPRDTTASNGPTINSGTYYAQPALWYAVDTTFLNLKDPRVPTTTARVRSMAANTSIFVASKPKSFGGYVAPSSLKPAGQAMTPGASIRIASYLEAQYIIAEANGGNAQTLAFVNQQRAANNQPASTASSPNDVLKDLQDQRRREFYLDGHRLGDLRRYIAIQKQDYFPSGPISAGNTTTYSTATCFPIPISELNANPNVPAS